MFRGMAGSAARARLVVAATFASTVSSAVRARVGGGGI